MTGMDGTPFMHNFRSVLNVELGVGHFEFLNKYA